MIFGCGNIANRIARSCKLVDEIDLVGFASKDIEKARRYAETYGCRDYGDYDHFLNSDVDAVYIATYNLSHHELIERCIRHRKNVICEKPMLFSVEENRELFSYARENDVLLMEALKSVFLPLINKIKTMIDNGDLGKIRYISAGFMRNGSHGKDHWIHIPGTGGALKDLGSYCIGTMNFLMDREPEIVSIETDAVAGRSDTTAYADLLYGDVQARAMMSNSLDGDNRLYIEGERGYIEVNDYWKTGKGICVIDGDKKELNEELISDFYYELKHFASLCDQGIKESPVMSELASERILKVTDHDQEN